MWFDRLKNALYLFCCLPFLAAAEPVTLPGTESFQLSNSAGQTYQIMISLPEKQRKDKPAAVLYLLDGNAFFAAFHDAKRLQQAFAGHIIVAVGYPTDTPFDFYRRSYDFRRRRKLLMWTLHKEGRMPFCIFWKTHYNLR